MLERLRYILSLNRHIEFFSSLEGNWGLVPYLCRSALFWVSLLCLVGYTIDPSFVWVEYIVKGMTLFIILDVFPLFISKVVMDLKGIVSIVVLLLLVCSLVDFLLLGVEQALSQLVFSLVVMITVLCIPEEY